ncbi:MAG TPA: hypothetical protein DEB17_06955 [Chlorobaculum sp.]|jgi:hypothetical protein|uniref:hypothetical protein n=1 Tax=Chlorobaculum tepidum TaxID=1097 RepID=UPI0002F8837C|nr:hypothetical protein [Chlorobaculum tepidum]HBU23712.1 hypothetical protein [Chlorobaculum sp.]
MLKFILLLIALWLVVRFLRRLIGLTFFVRSDDRMGGGLSSFSSSAGRQAQVEEAEYEVIDSQIKQKE